MPLVVALDTSTPTIGVAVGNGDELSSTSLPAGRETGALLPGAVVRTLADLGASIRDIDAVAVGVGPGPYTSLRVGIMFARAAAAALSVPIVGACSLDIVARGLPIGDRLVLTDARRREVYWARYIDGRRVTGPLVGRVQDVRDAHSGVRLVEPEHGVDAGLLVGWVMSAWPPQVSLLPAVPGVPGALASAGADGSDAGQVPQTLLAPNPLYLRRPDAVEPALA